MINNNERDIEFYKASQSAPQNWALPELMLSVGLLAPPSVAVTTLGTLLEPATVLATVSEASLSDDPGPGGNESGGILACVEFSSVGLGPVGPVTPVGSVLSAVDSVSPDTPVASVEASEVATVG